MPEHTAKTLKFHNGQMNENVQASITSDPRVINTRDAQFGFFKSILVTIVYFGQ